MERNPFDQFDAPSGASSTGQNVFDQFDQPDEIVTLPAVQAAKPDFSEVASSWDSTAELPGNALGRWLGQYGGRQVLQGAGGLLGALGGDAFNHYVVDPIRRRLHEPTEEDIATGRESFVPTAPYRQVGEQIADELGMQRPQTKAQRIVSDIGEGLTGTALTLGAGSAASGGRGLAQTAGEFFAANPVLQTAATVAGTGASSAVREAGGGTGAQVAAGLAGGFAPGVASALPGMRSGIVPQAVADATRGALRGRNASGERVTAQDVERAISDFAAAGTSPSVGQATGGRFAQATETMLGNVAGGSGPIARLARNQADNANAAIGQYAAELSPRGRAMSPEQAGRTILEGIEGKSAAAFVPKTAKRAEELYGRVSKQIAPDARVPVENTQRALADLNASIEGAPNVARLFQNARIRGIGGALDEDVGGMEAALQRPDVQRQAEQLKQQLEDQAQRAAADNARLQSLGMRGSLPVLTPQQIDEQVVTAISGMADNQLPYQALTKLRTLVGRELDNYSLADSVPRDMWKTLYGALTKDMEAAATTPEARQAWSRANTYYAARSKRIDAVAHVVDKSGGPEAVYKAAFGNTREGATTLRAVMQSLPKDAQREVSASFIRRMGRATGSQQNADSDVFSMETFLTNWANMSPEAKRVLFDRHGLGFRQDMDRIARMTDRIRQGSSVFRNPSGSARLISLITQSAGTASSAGSALVAGSPLLAAGIVSGSMALAGGLNGLARLMTSPGFVRWVAQNGEKPIGELIPQARLLREIAEREDNPDLDAFADRLEATRPQRSP